MARSIEVANRIGDGISRGYCVSVSLLMLGVSLETTSSFTAVGLSSSDIFKRLVEKVLVERSS